MCDVCNKFKIIFLFFVHVLLMYPQKVSPILYRPYECDVCNKRFQALVTFVHSYIFLRNKSFKFNILFSPFPIIVNVSTEYLANFVTTL